MTMTGIRYEQFGNVIREVKDELSLNERQLELVARNRKPDAPNSSGLNVKRIGTGTVTRRNLIHFPKALPLVINSREYSRKEIARAAGCDIAHISKIFLAKRCPSLFMARKIAVYLGMSTDEFYDILTRIDVGQDDSYVGDAPRGFQPITT